MPALVHALERATLNALPSPRVVFDGPFVVRAFLGGTGRANAACSLDPSPDPDLAARIARVTAHYERLGLTPRFRSAPLDPPGLEALLRAGGWVDADESHVTCGQVAPLEDSAITLLPAPDAAWLEVIGTVEYQSAKRRAEKLEAVNLFAIPAIWLVLRQEGQAVAAMSATCDGRFTGLFDIAVRPEFRRRGLAQRMIRAAAHWGQGLGAEACFAQVAITNAASVALQAGLGLTEAYRYRYFVLR
jgi:ribosomal protein S18 acetylase RimI-like enzyme